MPCLYMGVSFLSWNGTNLHFSTAKASYPQIIATYPQFESPEGGYGGLPCPLNVGDVLSNLELIFV